MAIPTPCCKRLIDRVNDGECVLTTDDGAGFYQLLPEDRHFPGKDLTFPIEASNSDIRHRLAWFARRTKAFSRSLHMVHARLKLSHHLQDESVLQSYLNPLISIVNERSLFFKKLYFWLFSMVESGGIEPPTSTMPL
jgi:hypothetical protein